jgi:hypothetical protein
MPNTHDKPNLGCLFLFGFIMGGAGVVTALAMGFPYWVAQQAFIMAVAMGLLPAAQRVPILRNMPDATNRLAMYYVQRPRLLRPMGLLGRMIPIWNYIIMFRELRVMFLFLVIGIPLDLAIIAFTTYVIPLPTWGPAKTMDFWQSFGMQTYFTFLYTPYLVMLILALKWNRFAAKYVPPPLPTTIDKRW